ncbi:hypothetical protein C8R44DRAFT_852209 [Mycena epipterygia]|nr:hypothetical protein C8R44DRAFT_852209 [Mycena epipterygia]
MAVASPFRAVYIFFKTAAGNGRVETAVPVMDTANSPRYIPLLDVHPSEIRWLQAKEKYFNGHSRTLGRSNHVLESISHRTKTDVQLWPGEEDASIILDTKEWQTDARLTLIAVTNPLAQRDFIDVWILDHLPPISSKTQKLTPQCQKRCDPSIVERKGRVLYPDPVECDRIPCSQDAGCDVVTVEEERVTATDGSREFR